MNAKTAQTILGLFSNISLSELIQLNAVAAVAELTEIAYPTSTALYITVPTSNGSTHKVECIKTLRQITGMGLKEAKDMFDAAWPASVPVQGGLAFRVGPFDFGITLEEARRRLEGHTSVLEVTAR